MPSASTQDKVRPHRVKITYEVDEGGAKVLKEIPFVIGVMADLSADNKAALPELAERKFSDPIDAHTFDTFLASQAPTLNFDVKNLLTGEGRLPVELTFNSMEDFSPAAVARSVAGLKELFEARQALSSLLTKVESKPKLEKALDGLLKDPKLAELVKNAAELSKAE